MVEIHIYDIIPLIGIPGTAERQTQLQYKLPLL